VPSIAYEVQQCSKSDRMWMWVCVSTYLVDDDEGDCRRRAIDSMAKWAISFPENYYRVARVEVAAYS
jgi:hypothetical protein